MNEKPVFIGTSLINQTEQTAAIYKKAKESKGFKILQKEFFPNQELEVKESFKLASQEPEERQFDARGIMLASSDQKVILNFIEGTREQKPLKMINVLVVTEVGGSEVVRSFEVDSKNEISFIAENIFEGTVKEEFIDSLEKPLFPESYNEVESQVQAFVNGCLWGGYRWCGKGCFNYPDIGGDGSYINSTDLCCKNHDYCFKNGYVTKAKCNESFCACLKGKTTVGANMAKAWYCVF